MRPQYMIRLIDDRDRWTKLVKWYSWRENISTDEPDYLIETLTAAKRFAHVFDSLSEAVKVRNALNKRGHVKAAWIVHI